MIRVLRLMSFAVALLAVSCSQEPVTDDVPLGSGGTETPEQGPMKYITIGIEPSSRISVGEGENNEIPLYWSEGDKLIVNKTKDSSAISADYDGKSVAVIGIPEAATYPMTLVYPAAARKGAKWFYIDTEQTYAPAKFANGWAILMGTVAEAGDVVTMQHMCGYMKVSLTGSTTIKRVMLRTMGHEPLSGYFRYPTTSATDGVIGMEYFNTGDLANGCFDSPVVSINCGEGVALSGEATDFYFALPVATYAKGFELTVVDASGKQQCVTSYTSGKEVKAGALIEMPALAVNCTEEPGIYTANELAGYVRTLEKDVWLDVADDATLHIRADIDLSTEDLSDLAQTLQESRQMGELFYWRNVNTSGNYNCSALTTIDGHDYAITGYNSTVTAAGAGLLFHEIPATLTVKNLSLGKSADDPATDANEADCTLTATGSGSADDSVSAFGAFCYNLLGTIENCKNYASVKVTGTGSGEVRVGGFHGGLEQSVGIIKNLTNYGYIYFDGSGISGGTTNYVGGVAPYVPEGAQAENCVNAGYVIVNAPTVGTRMGGVFGETAVAITGCSNSGDISLTGTPGAACRVGGVIGQSAALVTSCTNTGNVTTASSATTHIGGVVATNAFAGQTFDDCVNGEQDTDKGKLRVTKSNNVYAGGIVGCNSEAVAVVNATNYGPIDIDGTVAYMYIGCVGGWTETSGTTYDNCKNYGVLTVNVSTAKSGYSYVGGISGTNKNNVITVKNSANYGNFTIDAATVKVRYGGIAGNLGNNVSNCHGEFDITIDQVAEASAIGGLGGYVPKSGAIIDGCSYKGTITNNDPDATASVTIASLFGTSQNITCCATMIEPTMINNAGSPSFGLIGAAVGAGKTMIVGGDDKPFKISTKSKFLGIDVSEATVAVHRSDEGATGKAYLDASTDANKFTTTLKNLTYVSSIE